MPAPLTRVVCSWGRGARTQEEAEGRTAGNQGANEAAVEGPAERGDKADEQKEEADNNEDSPSSNESDSSSGEQSKDEQPTKPPARSKGPTKKKASKNLDKGKEGTADDIPIPCKMEARRKERKPGGRPTIRARAESCTNRSASELARLVGNFGIL